MLAQNNTAFAEAAETMYKFTADPKLQYYYEKRQETLNHERATKALLSRQEKALAEKDMALAESEKALTESKKVIIKKDTEIAALQQKIKELEAKQN